MSKVKSIAKRYRFFIIMFLINIILLFAAPEVGKSSFKMTASNFMEMMLVIPPIFVLLGLLDVWVERETMMKHMGKDSGIKGALIAFLMGSAAAGPLYAAFPIAGMLMKKGVRLLNVFIFIGAWSTTKIPMLMFEITNMGPYFMLLRLGLNIFGIIGIAFMLEKTIKDDEKDAIYERAGNL